MTSYENLTERLNKAAHEVSSYQGSTESLAHIALVDALLDLYLQDLCNVSPCRLQRMQGYVQQLQELRGVMSGEVKTNGRL